MLRAQLQERPATTPVQDFLGYLAENEIQTLKMILNGQGAVQYAVEAMMGINNALQVGFKSGDYIVTILTSRAVGLDAARDIMRSWGATTKVVLALKSLGNIALVVQVLATEVVVIAHFRAGRFGPGFSEFYATPWARRARWAAS
ncbi:hypothetical protein OVA07_14785 [Novosphingobium sp. SL115]|uniref:hypothetical protein n=1 Tax=Novosphingobium sp. SL115 TaxID=2995150 RepID=UPI002276C093|nr:hypothetical protein [Novosphingobium sp. SL115]MCY1672270.1 hypothetical protein [Novosphingobium sp. SL115]